MLASIVEVALAVCPLVLGLSCLAGESPVGWDVHS